MLKLDLHMHSTVSDGTDTPEELLSYVMQAGINIFSLTDHDDISGYNQIIASCNTDGLKLLSGVEFSCSDNNGKYHILGYNFDVSSSYILDLMARCHNKRIEKVKKRLEFLSKEFSVSFPESEIKNLFLNRNPGKPHIANLMVKYNYAESKDIAIHEFIDKLKLEEDYIDPKEAILTITNAGGIPILAHPSYGSGDQLILGREMEERLQMLISYGLMGVEAFYSGFTDKLRGEMLSFAKKYNLFVTAGSDYHGKNKLTMLGDTGLETVSSLRDLPEGLIRFLEKVNVLDKI